MPTKREAKSASYSWQGEAKLPVKQRRHSDDMSVTQCGDVRHLAVSSAEAQTQVGSAGIVVIPAGSCFPAPRDLAGRSGKEND